MNKSKKTRTAKKAKTPPITVKALLASDLQQINGGNKTTCYCCIDSKVEAK